MSTSTNDARPGARTTTPTTDPWAAKDDREQFTTDRAPFQFDPHLQSQLPNRCDETNKSTPQ